ncbi:SOUL family heme-binding protein [Paeniglutamicibacter cryotolerans]|uniref:Heme-binding protein n=1 Tax=Paeniglutamicibacter cryotolerans TaxID=670079 RepID=A0A839QE66_9MICC|nr:heme-binding protein [Paeniglutamicibacter cryotolerans]MBB2994538.1 hypothetical protein [Paeniglutamicibacter cryotolerans]
MTEQQPYRVEQSRAEFEIRRYPEHLLAEVLVDASFEDAGNRAFRDLFGYIGGGNRLSRDIAMTAPVVQTAASEKIAMTAPVIQQGIGDSSAGGRTGRYRVAFVLPKQLRLESAPVPTNPRVHLRRVEEGLVAVKGYSGRWSQPNYQSHLQDLRIALRAAGFTTRGEPRFARFDPPFKPWFLRRNEIMFDLEDPS